MLSFNGSSITLLEKISLHIANLVQEYLSRGESDDSFKIDVGIKYLRNLVHGLLNSAYEYVESKSELVLNHLMELFSCLLGTIQFKMKQ